LNKKLKKGGKKVMSKKSLILMVVVAFALSLGIGVSMSLAKGPAEIILNADGKKPVKFPHAKHQEKNDCATCHHTNVDGKQTPVEGENVMEDGSAKCDSCHKEGFQNEKLAKWKDIGHGLCKDCHTKMKAEGAPTKCNDCHIKK
jgi:Class III cytochrome C family